jgi:ABC-type dipeptide/oligopeptide/nickel transport system permease component
VRMKAYVVKRLLVAVPTVFAVLVITFLLMHAAPGSPVDTLIGDRQVTAEERARLEREAGLDKPLVVQFFGYLGRFARGDLGQIFGTRRSIAAELRVRLPNTLTLALVAVLLATLLGVTTGVVSAVKRNSLADAVFRLLTFFCISAPVFWFGLMLIVVFALRLGWLPAAGSDTWAHLVLPALTLGLRPAAFIARVTRSTMLDVLGENYILTARAKGLPERTVVGKHALWNVALPVVTVIAADLGNLLGGTVITETVFGFVGLGAFAVEAILNRWYSAIMAVAMLWGIIFVVVNLAVDVLYVLLDPRIRLTGEEA